MEELQSLFQVRHATHDDIYSILSITKEAFTKYEELVGVCGIDALSKHMKM